MQGGDSLDAKSLQDVPFDTFILYNPVYISINDVKQCGVYKGRDPKDLVKIPVLAELVMPLIGVAYPEARVAALATTCLPRI